MEQGRLNASPQGQQEKAGGCIDPNGCANDVTSSQPAGPACGAWNEAGACIDPNG